MRLRTFLFSRPRFSRSFAQRIWFAHGPTAVVGAMIFLVLPSRAAEVKVITDIAYKQGAGLTEGEREHCRLDLYLPPGGAKGPALLWLHGGGLTGGTRNSAVTQRVARRLAEAGIAVASAEYRKNPDVTFPAYISDAAAAFAWLHQTIAGYGGDSTCVFIGGHSAGAYLALMVALDDRYLAACGLDEASLAGVVAISGQTSTHFTVRAERRSESDGIVVDDAAPLFHVRPRGFPLLVAFAGKDMPLRVEENRLLAEALLQAGCADVREAFFEDRDHGSIVSRMAEPEDRVAREVIQFLETAKRVPAKARRE